MEAGTGEMDHPEDHPGDHPGDHLEDHRDHQDHRTVTEETHQTTAAQKTYEWPAPSLG
jgi:hypothetical protein